MSSSQALDLLEALQPIVYGLVTAVALFQWRRRPGPSGAWLTVTFATLTLVLSVERYLPDIANAALDDWVDKLELGFVALFPYCLYRFMTTFISPSRARRAFAAALTAVVVVAALTLPDFGALDDSPLAAVFFVLFILQWVLLSGVVAVRFWRAGRGQPTVARRRMRTMSAGAVGLALAFVIGIASSWDDNLAVVVTYALALVVAPLMLIGFAPPYALRAAWRRSEEAALREARLALMEASTAEDVTHTLLREARSLVGARAAFLEEADGELVAGDQLTKNEIAAILASVEHGDPRAAQAQVGSLLRIPMSEGRILTVVASPFTPFFGRDEVDSLEALAALAALALVRTDLLDNQSRLAADADRANQAKSEFLSRMSHELRTPLNSILGFAQLLEMDPLPPHQQDSVDHVLKAGRHLLELIDEVLDIARIEEGRLSLSLEPVKVRDPLGDAVDLVRPLAGQRGVRVTMGDVAAAERYVLADRQRLKQVLLNLLANAIKYNREGGSVVLSCRPVGDLLRVSITDTGFGIAPADVERLFTPFERLGAEQFGVEGTGIGLALSKRLVELMGGTIGAESEVGKGSTFWIDLQVATHAVEEHEETAVAEPSLNGHTSHERSILYVEDNLANLRLVEKIIARRPNIRLLSAMQGGLGLELARQHRPDLILLDVHLPDMGGEQVLAQLRAETATAQIPVVMISAEATRSKIERLLSTGAHAYMTKPLDIARFLEIIDETLDGR